MQLRNSGEGDTGQKCKILAVEFEAFAVHMTSSNVEAVTCAGTTCTTAPKLHGA